MRIREFIEEDIPAVLEIWRLAELSLGLSDTPEELKRFLKMNPTTSLVGEDGFLIAAVLGGFDGRRGLVHHLAVLPELQGRGYGRAMMIELEHRFRQMGVVKINFWVEARNLQVVTFYERLNYQKRDLLTMSKVLRS
jgi:N-acetylglutamate synthase